MTFNKRPYAGLLCALGLFGSAVGCGWFRSSINDSPGLRWWLFSNFGAQQICPEMLKRGVALRPDAQGNVIGRFFPQNCTYQLNEPTQTVAVNFEGSGLVWTPLAGRVGFRAHASVEYRMDFNLAEDALYVWGEPQRLLAGPAFQIASVESKLVDWARQSPFGHLGNTLGAQIASSQIASGFTVVRTDAGDEFALGRLRPPERPKKPFLLDDDERFVFSNETTDVQAGQVDFLGPFEVPDEEQALFLRFVTVGPPLDAILMRRGTGDLWRQALVLGTALGPPPEPPIKTWVLRPGPEQRELIPVPPGQYYVVVDNSSAVGSVAPPWNPLGAMGMNGGAVSYTAELGDDDDEF